MKARRSSAAERAPEAWLTSSAIAATTAGVAFTLVALLSAGAHRLSAAEVDPRIHLLEAQRSGDLRGALRESNRLIEGDPARARALGLGLLRGHLLTRLGQPSDAARALAAALGESPDLEPWSRLRLAETQERLGHPEVAAGIALSLLASDSPEALRWPAAVLLARSLRAGGDCRLLHAITESPATAPSRTPSGRGRERAQATERQIALARAECQVRSGEIEEAQHRLAGLLLAKQDDLASFDAAELWLERWPPPAELELLRSLGSALAAQRDFEHAVPILERVLAAEEPGGGAKAAATLYLLARSEFWLGHHERAARVFEEVFRTARATALRADARYQQGRCLELAGDFAAAAPLFAEAYELDPNGEWSGPALLSQLRLAWLAGRSLEAASLLEQLAADRGKRSTLARGAIFLAASELTAGRPSKEVRRWLNLVEESGAGSREEVAYWRGRLAELDRRLPDAVARYFEAAQARPFHPYAIAAKERLARAELAAEAARRAAPLAASSALDDLRSVWVLQGPERPIALQARARALRALSADSHVEIWIRWSPVPIAEWPLFRDSVTTAEERLLALGLWREGRAELYRKFPLRQKRLAFTASSVLAELDQSDLAIGFAERLFEGRPRALPEDWVDPDLRRLLYPFPYRNAILAQATVRGIRPWLLLAILREESRFDPNAVSPAAARGLAQLILPTARRLATKMGLPAPGAADLERPEVAIPIAATYLAELNARFDGAELATIAAYNAGESQAELWRKYCRTSEPEELLAKIGFRETRAYVARVLESRAHYLALYGL